MNLKCINFAAKRLVLSIEVGITSSELVYGLLESTALFCEKAYRFLSSRMLIPAMLMASAHMFSFFAISLTSSAGSTTKSV